MLSFFDNTINLMNYLKDKRSGPLPYLLAWFAIAVALAPWAV